MMLHHPQGDQPVDGRDSIIWISHSSRERSYRSKYYFVIPARKSPTDCTTIPIVSVGLFMYRPKWRRSPVRKCVALHRCAEANTGRSFSGSKSVHRSPATSGTRRTIRKISDNRPSAAGCFLSRFSRASARQYALVTTSQFPAAASSMTRDAFPSGL
jgi:hypothetical protein